MKVSAWPCTECPRGFPTSQGLGQHLRRVHGIGRKPKEVYDGPRDVIADRLSKWFGENGTLRVYDGADRLILDLRRAGWVILPVGAEMDDLA